MVSVEQLNDKQLLTAAAIEGAFQQHQKRKALTRYLRKRRQMKHLKGITATGLVEWDQLSALSNTLTKHELQIQRLQQSQLPNLLFNRAAAANQLVMSKSLSPQPCTYIQQTNASGLHQQRSGSTTPKITYYGDIYTSSGTTSSAVAAHLAASGVSAVPLAMTQPQQQQLTTTTTNRKLPPMPSSACLSGAVPSTFNQNLSSPVGQQLTVSSSNQLEPAISPTRNQIVSPKRYHHHHKESKSTYQPYDNYEDSYDNEQMLFEEDEPLDESDFNNELDTLNYSTTDEPWSQQTTKKRSLDAKQAMISYGNRRLPQIGINNNVSPRHRKLPHITDT